jgi:Co/Zn/Cd efflux system component
MARFTQLISPILQSPTPGHFVFGRMTARLWSNLLAWVLVIFSFYCCIMSESILLLGLAIVQIAFSLLILLESLLEKVKAGPLESRRLEMTAYCIGGVILLLLCIYQFNQAYRSLQTPNIYRSSMVTLAACSSFAGNLLLVRLLWRSGLMCSRIRAFCGPVLGILFFNLFSILASIFIRLTHYDFIDAVLAMMSSILLTIVAGKYIQRFWLANTNPNKKLVINNLKNKDF